MEVTQTYAWPGGELVGERWYERHIEIRLLMKIRDEKNSTGVIGCEVDCGGGVGSEVKRPRALWEVKMSSSRTCNNHVTQTKKQTMSLKHRTKYSVEPHFLFVVALPPLLSLYLAVQVHRARQGSALEETALRTAQSNPTDVRRSTTAFTALRVIS